MIGKPDNKSVFEPGYPDDFSDRPVDKDLSTVTNLFNCFGGYSATPALLQKSGEYALVRAMRRYLGADPFSKIEDEIETKAQEATSEIDGAVKEKLDLYFATAEQMVKMKVPSSVVSRIVEQALSLLNITDPAIMAEVRSAEYRWYTEVQSEIQATGEVANVDDAR